MTVFDDPNFKKWQATPLRRMSDGTLFLFEHNESGAHWAKLLDENGLVLGIRSMSWNDMLSSVPAEEVLL